MYFAAFATVQKKQFKLQYAVGLHRLPYIITDYHKLPHITPIYLKNYVFYPHIILDYHSLP